MFDGIKLAINDNVTTEHLNKYLDYFVAHKESGEVINANDKSIKPRFKYKYAERQSFKFKQFESGRLDASGSLHYYFNNGLNNYTQFTLKDVAEAITKFANEFIINPNTTVVHNLEFGVNLLVPFNPDYFIDSLIAHKTNLFNTMLAPFYGKTSEHENAQYWIKCYNKGQQFGLKNILRFELRFTKMEKIGKKVYLADLLNPAIIEKCKMLLLECFTELIIKEPVTGLSDKEQIFYQKYINPNYHNDATKDKNKRCREKKDYKGLLNNHSTDRLKEKTFKILVETLNNITSEYPNRCNLLTDIAGPSLQPLNSIEKTSLQPFDCLPKRSKSCTDLTILNRAQKCISCGRDITNQKAGSKYCSEKLHGKEAKKCRNKNSNAANNFKRKLAHINANGTLFDIMPFFKNNWS